MRVLQQVLEQDYNIDFGDWDISGYNPLGANVANVGVSADGTVFYGSTGHPQTGMETSWLAYTQPAPNPGDIDGNGVVGVSDLLILLAQWGECSSENCPADIDGDGSVNVQDLLVLLANWG